MKDTVICPCPPKVFPLDQREAFMFCNSLFTVVKDLATLEKLTNFISLTPTILSISSKSYGDVEVAVEVLF